MSSARISLASIYLTHRLLVTWTHHSNVDGVTFGAHLEHGNRTMHLSVVAVKSCGVANRLQFIDSRHNGTR